MAVADFEVTFATVIAVESGHFFAGVPALEKP
jgi:hypothetical protein